MLSEARKYGLSLLMAHQTLAQVSSELRSLVLGNMGIQIYFRVGHHDAQVLANEAFVYSPYEVKSISKRGVRFKSAGEQHQLLAQDIQNLPPRFCYAKHKIEGGLVTLLTVDIEPPNEVLGLGEEEHSEYLAGLAIGRKYMVTRDDLLADIATRVQEIESATPEIVPEKSAGGELRPGTDTTSIKPNPRSKTHKNQRPNSAQQSPLTESALLLPDDNAKQEILASTPKNSSQHRYLQNLIKQMGQERGFHVVLEESTPGKDGRVDVDLELAARLGISLRPPAWEGADS